MSQQTTRSLLTIAESGADESRGFAQSREAYLDPAIFEREMRRLVLRHWHCAGHVSALAGPGDWVTVEIAGESVIILRDGDGAVRAHLNVCRHRGSRLCLESAGHARGGALTCPYHAWIYTLDGALKTARHMGRDFDRNAHGLKPVQARVIEGLIFMSFDPDPPDLAPAEAVLAASLRAYGWADARIAHRQSWTVTANWKLAVENYHECYHCGPAHQEYARFHVNAKLGGQSDEIDDSLVARRAALGLAIADLDHWPSPPRPDREAARSMRSALYDGIVSGSEDGGPVAPLMGDFRDYDGGVTFVDVGPTSTFLAYPDHGLVYRFIPKTVGLTEIEVIWLVRGDAQAGVDYDFERLTWLWTVTSIADKRIIEMNQAGVNSRFFEPGPYTPMESQTSGFTDWCRAALA